MKKKFKRYTVLPIALLLAAVLVLCAAAVQTNDIAEGTLLVFSSGVPDSIVCTYQTQRKHVGGSAQFDVLPPMGAPSNYCLKYVLLNGTVLSPNDFETQYHYKVPVISGETIIEYLYVPKDEYGGEWTYSVEYYINGQLYDEWTSSGSVPSDNPVISYVGGGAPLLPNIYQYPVLSLPYKLRHNGEVIHINYIERSLTSVL